ncbi:TPA: hypothetical protein ACG3I4_000966 [Clostridioides difficile]|nr:hypothetical protein [Clostridioides difficile]MDV9594962.1 hypothetical protein [Clostridioides difficile]MDV9594976.1 hypothetical protein [Clostridioides difficile]MDV9595008.1 hypothetical protein [Clostridioides difficile]
MNYRLKKSVTTILSLLIMTILLPTNASASKVEDSSMKVMYSEKQVTDMDKLYDMAKMELLMLKVPMKKV